MKLIHISKTSIKALATNKSRSALTILGIVIGITSIILIISMGEGAQDLILGELGGLGADTIVLRPGREPKGPTDVAETLFADSLKQKDIDALKKKSNAPHILDIAPAVIVPGNVSYLGETYKGTTFGGSAKFIIDIFNIKIESGIIFDENEIKQKANVVIIGSKVKEELFGLSDALGKNIKIKDKNFKVIGVMAPQGQSAFFNIDEVLMIPYTTAQTYLLGIDYFHEIMIKTDNPESVQKTVQDIESTIRESHKITNPEKDDFFIVTQAGIIDQVSAILNILTIFLSSVVAISLVVGGIGVMNIMLVSVTERTKEIGLRKALGATNKDILIQFILESTILTAIGGAIGIAIGTLLSFTISIFLTTYLNIIWPFTFPFFASLLGLGVSSLVGLVFGLYPARKASLKSPIEALRYE